MSITINQIMFFSFDSIYSVDRVKSTPEAFTPTLTSRNHHHRALSCADTEIQVRFKITSTYFATTYYNFLRDVLCLGFFRLRARLVFVYASRVNKLACSSRLINCCSVTRPRSCPLCAIRTSICSIFPDKAGRTNDIRAT